ncbi:MAG: GNAT family N-acetyltransferase [Kofleriaceae bacterium]
MSTAPAWHHRAVSTVTLTGRYECRDHGPDRPWTSAVVDAGGVIHDLVERTDDERAALAGRQVRVEGTPRGGAFEVVAVAPTAALPVEDPVPAGMVGVDRTVEVVIVWLELTARPPAPVPPAPADVVVVPTRPSVRYYRYLYDAVGAPWHWYDRKRWSDAELAAHLAAPGVEVAVVHHAGTPVGYAELDRRTAGACELVYFGLVPEAAGRGLGRWFLAHTVAAAWRDPALARLWVHTCSLDGPAALPTYRRSGFVAYRHERLRQRIVEAPPPC